MSDHLIDHRYTVIEIERMRKATRAIMFPIVWYSRTSGGVPGTGSADRPEEKVELQLRTYMLAGVRPEELEALEKQREEDSKLQRLSFPERGAA